MFRSLSIAATILALPAIAMGQEPQQATSPGTLVLSSWKCPWNQIGRITQDADSLDVPIAQELINEGQWTSFAILIHDHGDEWNVVYSTGAPDVQRYLAGLEEFSRRFQQRHPDSPQSFQPCTEHRDNIYLWGPRADPLGASSGLQ